jgi:hypothetical protein
MSEPTPSKERGETLREAADIVRGMLFSGHYKPEELAVKLDEFAEANDILFQRNQNLD